MASENEPAKLLLPYLQRADELQKHEPLVAYYCRLYAMERGLKIPQSDRTKTTNALLISLMNQLEKDKKTLKLEPDNQLHLEGFALNVFARADKQDRAGRADLNTAKTFYAASIFFEILNQFGELQPDLEQKQKYAAWKAADIRKALKEGRKPVPGPPVDENDLSLPNIPTSGAYDLGPSQTGTSFNPGPESDPSPQFHDSLSRHNSESDPSPQFHDSLSRHNSSDLLPPPPPSNFMPPPPPSNFTPPPPPTNITPSPPPTSIPPPPPTNIPPPPSYHSADYPSHDFHLPPPTNRSENSSYSQPYHHQQYPQEPPQPQNYPSHETPSPYSYPNFQSYPSFTESSLPATQSHYPSYYQGLDASYPPQAPPVSSYPSTVQHDSSSGNGVISEPAQTSSQTYQYDSNYQPAPEKIAEAHKAARFAVGALAFDDVSVAVDFLKKSLELLTNPSAGQ